MQAEPEQPIPGAVAKRKGRGVPTPPEYVPPSQKKRYDLRWQVRAKMLMPPM